MEWRDEGIILGTRRHGESSVILEAMTRAHGRHMGLVRGGRSRKQLPVLQPGNRVDLVWRARLDEHLGIFQAEALEMNAARLMDSALAVHALQLLAAHLRLLPERDPHPGIAALLEAILERLDEASVAAPMVVRFELQLLAELGFGLDLTECAATGATSELVYVSPKSGRAVSRAAGAPYTTKLLRLPAFLHEADTEPAAGDIDDAFALTGFFFERHVLEPRGMKLSAERAHFIAALTRALPSVA